MTPDSPAPGPGERAISPEGTYARRCNRGTTATARDGDRCSSGGRSRTEAGSTPLLSVADALRRSFRAAPMCRLRTTAAELRRLRLRELQVPNYQQSLCSWSVDAASPRQFDLSSGLNTHCNNHLRDIGQRFKFIRGPNGAALLCLDFQICRTRAFLSMKPRTRAYVCNHRKAF